jgi:histidinol-phosphate aminotransferase
MIKIENIVRPNILQLKPYSSARDEYDGIEAIFLDANENPFGDLNRYPDPYQKQLKGKLAKLKGVSEENIFVGNGSDEVIDLAFRIFCNPGVDSALIFSPTYGMYAVSAAINNIQFLTIPLNSAFQLNIEKVKPYLTDPTVKMIFICSPNNPTGNLIDQKDIEFVLTNFNGIVIVDEAYIDFVKGASLIRWVNKYNNLIVCQTFSKAYALAAARIGMAYAHKDVIALFSKVKPPYNVSALNQQAALDVLDKPEVFEQGISVILNERKRLEKELLEISLVKKIYPSDANFLLIEVGNADKLYALLVERKIITRNRNKLVANCIRITVGTTQENNALLNALKEIK